MCLQRKRTRQVGIGGTADSLAKEALYMVLFNVICVLKCFKNSASIRVHVARIIII